MWTSACSTQAVRVGLTEHRREAVDTYVEGIDAVIAALLFCLAKNLAWVVSREHLFFKYGPVAQRIEQRFPKPLFISTMSNAGAPQKNISSRKNEPPAGRDTLPVPRRCLTHPAPNWTPRLTH